MLVPKVPHILYGGDYTPEQWPEVVWQEDARLMCEAGVNIVSVGIFSWALLEPEPGTLTSPGSIASSICWRSMESWPIWPLPRHRLRPGWRASSRESAGRFRTARDSGRDRGKLLSQQSGVYGTCGGAGTPNRRALSGSSRLAMWHVNNEYACALPACYCDVSADHFRRWLRSRYGTLDALNHAWGTAFWSQRYGDWEEINPPRQAPTFINPSQQLDFRRFSSDAFLECFEMERAILAEITPGVPVTTNFMNLFKPLDYWTWASKEDVVSYDSYPDPADPDAPMWAACNYDLMRSLGDGRPWVLMEQATSQVNWRALNPAKRPGRMRLGSYAAVARGADGVMFFQWRQSTSGAEKFHSAMVPHAGTESRVWREVVQLGAELKHLDLLVGARSTARVAIVWDWENWWALETEGKPSADLRCVDQMIGYYAPLYRRNIAVDFVRPDDESLPIRRGPGAEPVSRPTGRGGESRTVRPSRRYAGDVLLQRHRGRDRPRVSWAPIPPRSGGCSV